MKIRFQYLVNKRMQLGFTLRFMVVCLVFCAFICIELYLAIWPVVSGFISSDLMVLVRHQILMRGLLVLLPAGLLVAIFSIFFSHRIAGPLYRLEKTLDKINNGESVPEIQVRRGDELVELTEKLNGLIRLAGRLEGVHK